MARISALRVTLALGLVAATALAGCGSLPTVGPSVAFKSEQAFVLAEAGYDGAVDIADTAINSGALSPATVRQLHTLVDQGKVYVIAGRSAVALVNASGVSAQTTALNALVGQIKTIAAPAKPSS